MLSRPGEPDAAELSQPSSTGQAEASGRRFDVGQHPAEREPRGQHERIAPSGWRVQDEVAEPFAGDAPTAVMQLHMVEPAEKDAAVDVGSALVAHHSSM